jgi:MFS transporter, DHA1 family, multidrug resistance protein
MKRLHPVAFASLVIGYALGPMATQIVTPAVPFVHRDFGGSMALAQTLVSLAFAAIAVATLVFGPLSDRYGRRPVILAGTLIFCVGSLMSALAPNAAWLIAGRVIQASGSSAALSLTRTVIHDVYGRQHSGRALAHLTTIMIFVPMLAPLLGGALLDTHGWRAVFAVCAVFGVTALLLLARFLPESRHEHAPGPGLKDAFAAYAQLVADPNYRTPALHFAWVMAAVFATQAAIPYLVVERMGCSATEYGAWFAVACLFYVAGNQFTARWGHRFATRNLIYYSGVGCGLVALSGMLATQVFPMSPALLFLPTIALYFCAAVGIAPVQAEAVAAQPNRAGAASGLLTAMQMAIGALTVQSIGFAHDGTPVPLFAALIACTAAALLYGRRLRRTPAATAAGDPALRQRSAFPPLSPPPVSLIPENRETGYRHG